MVINGALSYKDTFFDRTSRVYIESAVPNTQGTLSNNLSIGDKWNLYLRNTYFGTVEEATNNVEDVRRKYYGKTIRKKLREDVRLTKDGGAHAGGGVVATAAGTGIALFGLGKLTADTFTGFFNQKAPKRIAVAALAAAFIYGAAQEELGIPSLGDMYKGGKDWVISLTTSP